MSLHNLKTKCAADVQKYERTRACLREVIGRGPISELEREELKSSIKKLNCMIEQLAQVPSLTQHAQPNEAEHLVQEKKVKEAYKSLLSGSAFFRAIFK
jgi:hypothetical protein